jgi:hypothetical protein
MIELFYTGATKQGAQQIEPLFSLGGFLSSSHVANDFYSNLFGEVTLNTIKNKTIDHVCIALVPQQAIQGVHLTIKTKYSDQGRFRVGGVLVTQDDCKKFGIPKMQNVNSKPVNIDFYNCTSFYGETEIGFDQQQLEGTLFEIVSGVSVIGEFIYSKDYDYAEIYVDYSEDFELEVRFDYTLKVNKLFLIQKNINNFNTAIEIVRQQDQVEVGNVINKLPAENSVSLGEVDIDEILALYLERTISKETVKENSKLNCDKFFDDYEYSVTPSQSEILKLEINYEIVETPVP